MTLCSKAEPLCPQVYRQKGGSRVLVCHVGSVGWWVQDSVESTVALIDSASGSTCPANPRAAWSQRTGRNNWQIGGSDVVQGEITWAE